MEWEQINTKGLMRTIKRFEKLGGSLSIGALTGSRINARPLVAVILALLPLCVTAQLAQGIQATSVVGANSIAAASTDYAVSGIGPNYRVWTMATPEMTNDQGKVIYKTNSYTELATGMYHLVNGQWVESSENIEITPDGGVATNGQHQVGFSANINTPDAVEIITPDGQQLKTHIMGLSYYDADTGSNVLFAELQDSIGQVVNSNQVVYSNAFTDCDADVRYT
jgi:hypothetical protein